MRRKNEREEHVCLAKSSKKKMATKYKVLPIYFHNVWRSKVDSNFLQDATQIKIDRKTAIKLHHYHHRHHHHVFAIKFYGNLICWRAMLSAILQKRAKERRKVGGRVFGGERAKAYMYFYLYYDIYIFYSIPTGAKKCIRLNLSEKIKERKYRSYF